MNARVFDSRRLFLGEGPMWHPERAEYFWFDILNRTLYSGSGGQWTFDGYVSAAGWVDRRRMLIASETSFLLFDIETGQSIEIAPLERDNPETRSNDGRADPYGGFWIGTMSKTGQESAGAIYRFFRGEVRKLYPGISIPNAICFAPGGELAYFCDTTKGRIMRQRLDDRDGWPVGDPEVFVDLRAEGLNPDGAVVDAEGVLWNAQWGASRVAAYGPDGRFLRALSVPAPHSSCPAFGGPGLRQMLVTTAQEHLSEEEIEANPAHGQTFIFDDVAPGQSEHRVII